MHGSLYRTYAATFEEARAALRGGADRLQRLSEDVRRRPRAERLASTVAIQDARELSAPRPELEFARQLVLQAGAGSTGICRIRLVGKAIPARAVTR